MPEISVPLSFGDVLDRIAILQIRAERLSDPDRVANVRRELAVLENAWMAHPAAGRDIGRLRTDLKAVNERLWTLKDELRRKEQAQAFDDEFIRLARGIRAENDTRARIRREINQALGSSYVEERS